MPIVENIIWKEPVVIEVIVIESRDDYSKLLDYYSRI